MISSSPTFDYIQKEGYEMKVIAVIISVFLVFVILLAVWLDVPVFVAFLIAAAVAGVAIYLLDKWASSGEPVEREVTIEYDIKSQSAKLYKRVGANLNNMKIKQYSKTTVHYNPSKTVFTGANVGGVITGGFHQTEAYLSETSEGGSDAYYLEVKVPSETELFESEYIILKSIILTDELAEQAKNDKRVSKFLQGKTLVLKHDHTKAKLTSAEAEILKDSMQSGNYAMQQNITQRAFLASQLSWQECYDIKDWISGDVPQTTAKSANKKESTTKKKHPSYCVHRDKKTHCTCKLAKNYNHACSSTSGCIYYKDKR